MNTAFWDFAAAWNGRSKETEGGVATQKNKNVNGLRNDLSERLFVSPNVTGFIMTEQRLRDHTNGKLTMGTCCPLDGDKVVAFILWRRTTG